jgi:hypothetical protein
MTPARLAEIRRAAAFWRSHGWHGTADMLDELAAEVERLSAPPPLADAVQAHVDRERNNAEHA